MRYSKNTYRKKPYLLNLFFIGYLFGIGFFLSGVNWISHSLTFDESFGFLIPVAIIGFPICLGLFFGLANLLNIISNDFEERKSGVIVGISSVAGDKGKKSNYVYGAAKSSLTVYLSGLRNRLYSSNVIVMTVIPGFVDTKMTKDMDLPSFLTVSPNKVALSIYNAQLKGKNIIYIKWIWKWIMLIIKLIPESMFKKMSF